MMTALFAESSSAFEASSALPPMRLSSEQPAACVIANAIDLLRRLLFITPICCVEKSAAARASRFLIY
jgi:hypothetical protein